MGGTQGGLVGLYVSMRGTIFALIGLSLCLPAQTRSPAKTEALVIRYVKNLLASSFDSRLPRVSLEYFLTYETDDAPAKWTITQCKKRSAYRSTDPAGNSPTRVQADFDLTNGAALTVLIQVEPSQNGKLWEASLANLSITESTGNVRQIRRLADLPMELHRWPSSLKRPEAWASA